MEPKLQVKPSVPKREHPVLKNMKNLAFFLFLCVIFALFDPDPNPATQINAVPDTDPDPKPCLEFQVSEGLFVLSSMVRPKTLYSLGSNRGSGKKNIIYFKLVKRINYFVCRDE